MTYRERFVAELERMLGMPVLWAQKGPDAVDCSGSVTLALKRIGGQDLTHVDNAQKLHDETRLLGATPVDSPIAGDLVFYGSPPGPGEDRPRIEHVAVVDEYGGVISADGATSHITSLAVAIANPANRVRRHASRFYRKDTPLVVVHRNTFVDALDQVER